MITIDRISSNWCKVVIDPSVDGSKELLINDEINITRIALLDMPDIADMVKIHMVDGEILELHYSASVKVSGELAISNQDLIDKLEVLISL